MKSFPHSTRAGMSEVYRARDTRLEREVAPKLRDVRNLLAPDCDADYLISRAQALGVDELLKEVQAHDE